MNPLKRFIIAGLLLLAGSLVMAIDEPAEGQAPNFTLMTVDDQEITLSDFAGDVVVLHFWASYVPTSAGDVTILQAIVDHQDDTNLTIIGINHFDSDASMAEFIAETGITYPVADDPQGYVAELYALDAIPMTVIIDTNGQIITTYNQPLIADDIITLLETHVDNFTIPDTPVIAAPVPRDALDRYDAFEMTFNEEGFPVLGQVNAMVQIEYYASFSCPHCQRFHEVVFIPLVDIMRNQDISFTYIPVYSAGSVPNGRGANLAAFCAAEQDAFWVYHDMLYDWHARFRNEAFSQPRLREGAINIGLDMAQWDDCMTTAAYEDVLERGLQALIDSGYGGTPTITINGEQVAANLPEIRRVINEIFSNQT